MIDRTWAYTHILAICTKLNMQVKWHQVCWTSWNGTPVSDTVYQNWTCWLYRNSDSEPWKIGDWILTGKSVHFQLNEPQRISWPVFPWFMIIIYGLYIFAGNNRYLSTEIRKPKPKCRWKRWWNTWCHTNGLEMWWHLSGGVTRGSMKVSPLISNIWWPLRYVKLYFFLMTLREWLRFLLITFRKKRLSKKIHFRIAICNFRITNM